MTWSDAPISWVPLVAAGRDAIRARAASLGYVFLPGLLRSSPRLHALAADVVGVCGQRGWLTADGRTDPALRLGAYDDPRWIAVLQALMPRPSWAALASDPAICRVLEQIYGAPPVPWAGDICRVVSPAAPELTTRPHQDAAYLSGADDLWTAWMPLVDCPAALGPLAVLPGSHVDGLRPHGSGVDGVLVGPDEGPWHSGDLSVGDVLFFSAHTVHRALHNVTRDRLRLSVDFRYRSGLR